MRFLVDPRLSLLRTVCSAWHVARATDSTSLCTILDSGVVQLTPLKYGFPVSIQTHGPLACCKGHVPTRIC